MPPVSGVSSRVGKQMFTTIHYKEQSVIDTKAERLLSLADAARELPRCRGGKRPHIATVYRWTTNGCRGVILESVQVGNTRCTSREALARFFAALTDQAGAGRQARGEPPRHRRRAIERARESLRRAGV